MNILGVEVENFAEAWFKRLFVGSLPYTVRRVKLAYVPCLMSITSRLYCMYMIVTLPKVVQSSIELD